MTVDGLLRAGECVYSVADNGAGFDMAHADQLFKMFHRLHGAAQYPGTGIGLSIVQRIVERHGGVISAQAALGAGAKFTFTLPAQDWPTRPFQAAAALRRTAPALLRARQP